MPMVIKIGYTAYVVKKDSDAAAVIRALASAVEVDSTFAGDHEVYFPAPNPRSVSMTTVQSKHLLTSRPHKAGDGNVVDVDVHTFAVAKRR